MAYDRPHEDRLGTDGGAGRVLGWTGTGTAAYVSGSGSTPSVVYAECNSSFGLSVQTVLWDTFYDEESNVISGGTLTAALAAIGLTYASGVFAATVPGIIGFHLNFSPVSAPVAQGSRIRSSTSDMFTGGTEVSWGLVAPATGPLNALPPQGLTWMNEILYFRAGDTWELDCFVTGTTSAQVIDYADVGIMRLV